MLSNGINIIFIKNIWYNYLLNNTILNQICYKITRLNNIQVSLLSPSNSLNKNYLRYINFRKWKVFVVLNNWFLMSINKSLLIITLEILKINI